MHTFLPTLLVLALLAAAASPAAAAGAGTERSAQTTRVAQADDGGVAWSSLSPAARKLLAPLEGDWPQMSSQQKLKWVEMAHRLPTMSAEQQQRIQSRMADWARMSPAERGQARLRFLQAQRTGTEDREKSWDDYQALPTDQKKQFAARAAVPTPPVEGKARPADPRRGDRGLEQPAPKSNLVPNPNFAAQPKAIAPMTLKAGPGASTTLVTKPPAPPPHQQTGLPKIAASPSFVDRSTLLPKRGPQGAATAPIGDDEHADPVPRP
ncbi:DUF3106 domain-containing protein [Piscinibacter sakaiensis]|uniref:DUF3106 domain-containing protein n=1 Tax=Piscinibacter sakaiensis TaxID=1547922 RepID=UPI003AABDCFC